MIFNNCVSILGELIRSYDIPVTKTSIKEELETHPNHGTLLSISDALNKWKIPNQAFQIETDEFKKLPLPCIAHLKTKGGEFAIVFTLSKDFVILKKANGKETKLPMHDFEKIFTGKILVIQKDSNSGENGYWEKKKREYLQQLHYPILILGIFLVIALAINKSDLVDNLLNWQTILLILVKVSGLITGIFLLMHSVDANNPMILRLCSGSKYNCNAILSSKAAKITNFLSWSEVGLFYFCGTLIFLLFNPLIKETFYILFILNLFCLPYSIYSIYYQYHVAKQWCKFCLIIQCIFWIEFSTLFPFWHNIAFPQTSTFLIFFICFLTPIIAYYLIKPLLLETQKIMPLQKQLNQFKYNKTAFQNALKHQNKIELLDHTKSIFIGNPSASNTLSIVSNPFCNPCSDAHKILEQWLQEKDSFKLQIIFSTSRQETKSKALVEHFLQLNKENKEKANNAINEWYQGKFRDIEDLKNKYPVENITNCTELLEDLNLWCKKAEIKATPTIFLNGYMLPAPWQYREIKYFI